MEKMETRVEKLEHRVNELSDVLKGALRCMHSLAEEGANTSLADIRVSKSRAIMRLERFLAVAEHRVMEILKD
jgi:hypothetical protein